MTSLQLVGRQFLVSGDKLVTGNKAKIMRGPKRTAWGGGRGGEGVAWVKLIVA